MTDQAIFSINDLRSFLDRTEGLSSWQCLIPAQTLRSADPSGIYGSINFDSAYQMLARKTFHLPDIGCIHIRKGSVLGYGIATVGREALLDCNFTIANNELGLYGYFTELQRIGDERISGCYKTKLKLSEAVMLLHRGDTIHGHWLLEVLPRVLLSRKAGLDNPYYIVSSQIKEYQIEMLEALEIRRDRIVKIDRDEQIYCDRLVVPSIAHANLLWLHPFANETFNYLVEEAASRLPDEPLFERLFISRQSRQNDPRALQNRIAVERVLIEKGYEIVDPGALHWLQQVRLFNGARAIVGIGGSGLHNTAYTGNKAQVITLQPNQNWNYLQASIASIRGHKHSFFFGESMAAFDEVTWETPFIVDRELLAQVVPQ